MALVIKERHNGQIIAQGEENAQVRIFEGNWYFKADAVDMRDLKITERTYTCPYKGVCYWIDLETADGVKAQNIGWVYRQPKAGYEFIRDEIAFYARPTSGTLAEKISEASTAS